MSYAEAVARVTQIDAIQQSGWASSGYPDLPTLYQPLSV